MAASATVHRMWLAMFSVAPGMETAWRESIVDARVGMASLGDVNRSRERVLYKRYALYHRDGDSVPSSNPASFSFVQEPLQS